VNKEFETPPAVPKLPTLNQLHNHGTTAFPKWLETKNPRMEHNKFRARTKKCRDLENIFGAVNKFLGQGNKFPGIG